MHSPIFRNLILRPYESGIKRRKTFRYWHELERNQWLGRGELDEIQLAALRRVLAHAFESSPYYREEWTRLGLPGNRLDSLADFRHWPIISRDTIREHRAAMRSTTPGLRILAKATGGSSGVPLAFDIDTGSYERRVAATHRGYNWAGAPPGTRQLYLWGVPLGSQSVWNRSKDYLYARLNRRLVLNSFQLRDDNVADYLLQHNRYRPDVIVAYANPLYTFALALEERGLKPFSPRSIVVGAEKLHSFQRTVIERVFGAPVFETYGSREFMLIGAECEQHAGLHLTHENLLVEVLDDDGRSTPDGSEGNVVITDLYNYGMPFVRYVTGDRAIASWGVCPCGRGLPLLKRVVGRQLDVLQTPDGRRVPGEFFPHLIKDFPAVRRFQVVQEELACIQMRAVLRDSWTDADRGALEAEVRKVVGPVVRFEFQRVTDIPLTPVGKLQVVINRCGKMPDTADV